MGIPDLIDADKHLAKAAETVDYKARLIPDEVLKQIQETHKEKNEEI